MTQLKLCLLGSPDVFLDSEVFTGFRSDRVRALLVYLVVQGNSSHRRESLATLLWSEYPERAARASLRVSLANLRQSLAPFTTIDGEQPLLTITRQDVQFNADHNHCWIDVVEFETLLASCDKHSHEDLAHCQDCIQRLTQAVDLYRGNFLSGLSLPDSPPFDEWRLFRQEKFHQQVLVALNILTNYHINFGNFTRAQHYSRRQIEIEPWHEKAHQQLMWIFALSGQRNAALAQYEICRQILAEELGVEPDVETTATYEQIRAGAVTTEKSGEHLSLPMSLSALLHNLPAQTTPFVGRKLELSQITEMLKDSDCRLLTLVGAGGIGKSRLALQAATKQIGAFKDGVYFVPLVTINSTEMLVSSLVQTLHLSLYEREDPLAQLRQYLQEKEMLLILDNFENLSSKAEVLVDLLQHAPDLKILATSRERLNVQGEWLLNITGLSYPKNDQIEDIERFSAVQLFIQSARRVQPGFSPNEADRLFLIHICQLVEGMPLAIELAAAWLRILSCREIVQEIQRTLDFLTSSHQDLPERHRNLRAVFDYSWDLLSVEEKRVFRQLSVFKGGFDRIAAEHVVGIRPLILISLVDKSLVRRALSRYEDSMPRYDMHDLLQRYGHEQLTLARAEQKAVQEQHCLYYLDFIRRQERELKEKGQRKALQIIGAEIENLRIAWRWGVANSKIHEVAGALEGLFLFYYIRSWFREGEEAFRLVVESFKAEQAAENKIILAKASACLGWFVFNLGRQVEAQELLKEALALLRKLDARAEIAFCLNYLAAVTQYLGLYPEARQLCQEGLILYREIGDRYGIAAALNTLGRIAYMLGEIPQAQQLYKESLTLHRQIGDRWGIAFSLDYLGQIAYAHQDYEESRRLFQESLTTRQEIDDQRGTAIGFNYLGNIAEALGEYHEARQFYQQSLTTFKRIGYKLGVAQSLSHLGQVNYISGAYEAAGQNFVEALEVAMSAQAVPMALYLLTRLGELFIKLGQPERALNTLFVVSNHPASTQRSKERAERLYAQLTTASPTEVSKDQKIRKPKSLELVVEQIVAALK